MMKKMKKIRLSKINSKKNRRDIKITSKESPLMILINQCRLSEKQFSKEETLKTQCWVEN
jgi:hypothetical protein